MNPSTDLPEKGADRAIAAATRGWLGRADDNQKFALLALGFALAIGPMGQGVAGALGVLFRDAAVPSSKQVEAVIWLFWITLPVAAPLGVAMFFYDKLNFRGVILLMGLAAVWGAGQMSTVTTQLGDLYCYADLEEAQVLYEKGCREFGADGFVESSAVTQTLATGRPEQRAGFATAWALFFTVDARGVVMTFASILAMLSLGYLIRRELE